METFSTLLYGLYVLDYMYLTETSYLNTCKLKFSTIKYPTYLRICRESSYCTEEVTRSSNLLNLQ
jgi:hypothetical protein